MNSKKQIFLENGLVDENKTLETLEELKLEKLIEKSYENVRNDESNIEYERRVEELIRQNNGLHWDLVDAQMDANRLARMYIELCEAASPWMGKIQERRSKSMQYRFDAEEASMHRVKLNDQPRVRDENPQIFEKESVELKDVYPAPSSGGTVAVHLHLFYLDLAEEFIQYFNNIPFPFDLYISCDEKADIKSVCKKFSVLEMAQSVVVRKTENRGRDIAPLYVLFRKEISQHKFFLHVHSKKSLFTGSEQKEWRTGALKALCGSELHVRKLFGVLQSNRNVGLLFPETVNTMHWIGHSWLQNSHWGKKLEKELGFSTNETLFNYPVGSFFWARTEAIQDVFNREYAYEDFDKEEGQIDGTLAHALERAIAHVARNKGYSLAIIDNDEEVVRFGCSDKILQNYFRESLISAKKVLGRFEGVSFDIFDTLITRKIYAPDDLFKIMEKKISEKHGIPINYLKYRKLAEHRAWKKHGAKTDINHIYLEMPEVMNISEQTANEFKNMEIELEYELCIPRKEMLELFNYLQRKKIPIYLVSDMYLTADVIERMLQKCGYKGYSKLYLSCEIGLRKDDGTMWNFLIHEWNNERIIHVGDNLVSDMQRPGDCNIAIYPVMNPRLLFELSPIYSDLAKKVKADVANSYTMGVLVNECLFNSPFALKSRNKFRTLDYGVAAKAMFAPTLLSFVQAIQHNVEEGQELLFLAREGYFLQKLYESYYKVTERKLNPSSYFLASRRAVSVASINNKQDIEEILKDYYVGTLEILLQTRLGFKTPQGFGKLQIKMPEQIDVLMELLEHAVEHILERGEKENYIAYVQNFSFYKNNTIPVVIDLGYSGTIQYYLSQLIGRKVDGFYLYTEPKKKPQKIGCICKSIFSREGDLCGDKIAKNSLYLESILQAPYGQLTHFEKDKNGEVYPCYRAEELPPKEIFTMQQAILEYAMEYANFENRLGTPVDMDPELAIYSFINLVESRMLPDEIITIFSVEDFYCGNGIKRIDGKTGIWR